MDIPQDSAAEAKRHLAQAYALLDGVIEDWKDDLSLRAQAVLAAEHAKIALDMLRQADDLIRRRQQDGAE